MPPRSIKPGCRVSAIPSRARADIPVVMNDAAAPPTLLYGRVKEHAPPPYRSWIVVWEVDSKETTVSAQALTPLDDPVVLPNPDEIKQSEGREGPPRRAAAPRYLLEEDDSDEDESEWEDPPDEEPEEKKVEGKVPDPPLRPHGFQWAPVDGIKQDERERLHIPKKHSCMSISLTPRRLMFTIIVVKESLLSNEICRLKIGRRDSSQRSWE